MSHQSEQSLRELVDTLSRFSALLPSVDAAGAALIAALRSGGKILTAGNGGSAADALHLAEELVGRFSKNRRSLPAISLCADPTLLTCIANDFGFDQVFARQLESLGEPGDVFVAFSTSGNSKNINAALAVAKAASLSTVAVLGNDGGEARGIADYQIIVPSTVTARIQEVHTFVLHSWLEAVEDQCA